MKYDTTPTASSRRQSHRGEWERAFSLCWKKGLKVLKFQELWSLFLLCSSFVVWVSIYDAFDEMVADDVLLVELYHGNAFDVTQSFNGVFQSDFWLAGRSICVRSPVIIILPCTPRRVRNILSWAVVVFCASSNITIASGERAPAHESQWSNLNHTTLHIRWVWRQESYLAARRRGVASMGRFSLLHVARSPVSRPPLPQDRRGWCAWLRGSWVRALPELNGCVGLSATCRSYSKQ